MRTEGEFRALLTLLADESDRVASVAWETLRAEREAAVPYLTGAADAADPRLRGRARLLLEEMRLESFEEKWRTYADRPDEDLDLEQGCLLLARLADEVDVKAVGRFMDAIGGTVRARMQALDGPEALREVLFDNLGFRGGDFSAPENHYVPKVLERRTGIPISLAAVYVLIGRRIGLGVSGVAAPDRFLVRHERVDGPIFVDCYNRGRVYDYQTLVNWMESRGMVQVERYLAPCSTRFTLFRMMNNLDRVYEQNGDARMQALIRRFRDQLRPEQ